MKKKEWNEGLDHIDPDIVEKFIEQKDMIIQKKKQRRLWRGFIAASVCLCLALSVIVPMLIRLGYDSYIPHVSTVVSGNKITGRQELIYGAPEADNEGGTKRFRHGFYIKTVVEASVEAVLSDTYYVPDDSNRYLVARLSITEAVRGEGLPKEIYVRFPYYAADIFDGYDTFIFSLEQIGVENYMMINETEREVSYFSNMFQVMTEDLGHGSVIAFKDGKVDESFWDKTDLLCDRTWIDKMLSEPKKYSYPAGYESTLDEVKSNISELSNDEGSLFVDEFPCNYVTVSDVFVSDKGKQMENYVAPTESDVFMHRIFIRSDRVVATYTRVINGFTTEELITLNSPVAEKGSVTRQGAEYTFDDLSSVPDIGEAIEKLKLSGLKPSHIEIKDSMSFKYSIAQGFYRKVDGKVYGVVRVLWYYTHPNQKEYYIRDDRYYLYDEIGNGAIVEREELRALIGDDQIIKSFPYDLTLGLA